MVVDGRKSKGKKDIEGVEMMLEMDGKREMIKNEGEDEIGELDIIDKEG